MGSNMAENHPVGFQWAMEARLKGAKVMHVDPRFTRTSAMANLYVPIRAGTDIAFLGGIVNYILEHERWFDEYVKHYTNAPVIIDERFKDTEDLDGFFSGFDPDKRVYDTSTWHYAGMDVQETAGERAKRSTKGEQSGHGAQSGQLVHGEPPEEDETLQHPRCVFQILRKHYRRYTPEMVARICGCTEEQFLEVAEALCENSGRERTSAIAYSVGWTQHTVGVQYIRTAAIIQLLLGNMGRPGGGILALRGHASIQGSTDMATLYNVLPGYMPMPHAEQDTDYHTYLENHSGSTGWWGHFDAFFTSQLKAFWGEHATEANDFCFDYLPKIDGDHSTYQTAFDMYEGKVKGFFLFGENPGVGSAHAKLQRLALAKLDWLVVRDFFEIESAAFWKDAPEIETGELVTEEIGTEVFLLPAASHVEKDGAFTNTQRLLQWHFKALEPEGDRRSDLWFVYHLGRRIREQLAGSKEPRDKPILELAWPYAPSGPYEDPSADQVLREINGIGPDGKAIGTYADLKNDGSTSSGCSTAARTPTKRTSRPARSRAMSRARSHPNGAGPGRSTAGSSTTAHRPIRTESRGPSARSSSGGTQSRRSGRGRTTPTSRTTSRRITRRPKERLRKTPSRATILSSCNRTVGAGSTRRSGSWTGRCRRTTSPTSRRSTILSTRSALIRRASSSSTRSIPTTRPGARPIPTSSPPTGSPSTTRPVG